LDQIGRADKLQTGCWLLAASGEAGGQPRHRHKSKPERIKAKIGFSPPAFSLTLDRVAIDKFLHHETSINELEQLSENLQECTRLDDMAELSVIFGEILPAGKIYIILPRVSPYIVEALSLAPRMWFGD
jgi:hypothetical protein